VPPPRAHVVRCHHCGRDNRVPVSGRGIPRYGNCHQALPWVTDAGDEDFAAIIDDPAIAVLVDIWAPWCPLCVRANPALEQLAVALAGQVKLVEVNVATAPELQRRFAIESVPTLLLLRGPLVAAYRAGAPPEPSLRAWLALAREHIGTGQPFGRTSQLEDVGAGQQREGWGRERNVHAGGLRVAPGTPATGER